MKYHVNLKDVKGTDRDFYTSYYLLNKENGCINGCRAGISFHSRTEYPVPPYVQDIHDDQEGFLVLDGTGWCKIGDTEFRLEPDVAAFAPPGVEHMFKKDKDSKPLKIFWFHAAI